MKKLPVLIALLFLLLSGLLNAQGLSFHGKLQNSIYSYESDKVHTRFYQYAQFTAALPKNGISLNGSLRALTDAKESLDNNARFKAYALNAGFRKLLNTNLNIILGRQFLHPGTVLGSLDGMDVKYAWAKVWEAEVYGGKETNYLSSFDIAKSKSKNVLGGLLTWKGWPATSIQGFYLQKTHSGDKLWQLAGVNLENSPMTNTWVRLQLHLNLQKKEGVEDDSISQAGKQPAKSKVDIHRLLLNIRHSWSDRLSASIEYKMQQPQIYANSFFTIFELEAYQQFRLAADYKLTETISINGQYQLIALEGDQANRFILTAGNLDGSIGLVYENGYSGDQLSIMADYGYEIFRNLVASVYLDFSKYRIEKVYQYDEQAGSAARLSYSIGNSWLIDLELQRLQNKFQSSDIRFLNHISYRW